MSDQREGHLTLYILAAIAGAIVVAFLLPEFSLKLHVGGEIFLRLLKMMVVPLVVVSVMNGILGLGDVRKLGRPGGFAVLYYVGTTVLAVTVGLLVVNVIQPGVGAVDPEQLEAVAAGAGVAGIQQDATIGAIVENLLLMLFTDNLISSAAETNLLPLILFSIIFAGMLTTMGERVSTITQMISQVNDALLSFVLLLMRVAPLGIFCLVAARFGEAQAGGRLLEVIGQTGSYVLTILVGLGIHGLQGDPG